MNETLEIVRDESQLAAAIIEAGGKRIRGRSFLCPFHADRVPSMSIYEKGGHWRCKCHGCDFCGDVLDVRARASGLPVADVLREESKANGHKLNGTAPKRRIVATYDYTDEGGELLYQAVRYKPKDFRQRRPAGNGGWSYKLDGVRRVLYRLPDLIDAPDGAVIYIAEGEKDADRLRAEGLFSTTAAMGAGAWKHVEGSPLHGRGVVILPDNDDQGRKHAEDVARRLHGKAASVRVLELPGLPPKGDVSDWLDAGNDVEELDRLAVAASPYLPDAGKAVEHDDADPEKGVSRMNVTRLEDVQPVPIEWLWHNRIPRGHLSLKCGMQGLGKSMAAIDCAARISTGAAWPDGAANQLGTVVLLSLEDGLSDVIRPRLDHAGADCSRIYAITGVEEFDKSGERIFSAQRDAHMLETLIKQLGDVRLLIVDPLTAYLGEHDIYKDDQVRAALHPLGKLARDCSIAVLGIMHLRKSGHDKALYRVLGSVAFTAYARAVWLVGEDRDDPDMRLMLPAKMNIAKPAPGLRFSIVPPGRVEWSQQGVETSADEAFGDADNRHPDEAGPKVTEAMEWLESALAKGPQRAKTIKAWAKENSIADRTLRRAKAGLGVTSSQPSSIGDAWFWELPGWGEA